MKSLLVMLHSYLKEATGSEKEVIYYILHNLNEAGSLTIRELSKRTYASPSTIVRMCNNLKFSGYKQFKRSLIYETARQENSQKNKTVLPVEPGDSLEQIIDKVTYGNIHSLNSSSVRIDVEILETVLRLIESSPRIILFGLGASLLVAKDLYHKLLRINKPVQVAEDYLVQLLMAKNTNCQDMGIIFSYSGRTNEMARCVEEMNRNGATTVVITGFEKSPIAKMADYVLTLATNEHIFRSGAMASRIAQLNMVDILYTAIINQNVSMSMEQLSRTHITKNQEEDKEVEDDKFKEQKSERSSR